MGNISLRQGISFTRTEYGGVILDMQRGDYWRLNPVGAEVFASLVADNKADLVAIATEQFDIDAATAQRDIEGLLNHLRDLGLVVA